MANTQKEIADAQKEVVRLQKEMTDRQMEKEKNEQLVELIQSKIDSSFNDRYPTVKSWNG